MDDKPHLCKGHNMISLDNVFIQETITPINATNMSIVPKSFSLLSPESHCVPSVTLDGLHFLRFYVNGLTPCIIFGKGSGFFHTVSLSESPPHCWCNNSSDLSTPRGLPWCLWNCHVFIHSLWTDTQGGSHQAGMNIHVQICVNTCFLFPRINT